MPLAMNREVFITCAVTGSGGTQDNAALQQALQQAKQALADREAALKAGDWTKYGEADARLQQALQAAIAAEGGK